MNVCSNFIELDKKVDTNSITFKKNTKIIIKDGKEYKKTKYDGYLAGKDGNIYSMKRNIILSPRVDGDGYLEVSIMVNGKQMSKTVHRMIAEAWLPNPNSKPFVNHKNGNRSDNRVDNLEWITISDNNLGINKHDDEIKYKPKKRKDR